MAVGHASRLSFSGPAWILPRMSRRDRSRRNVPAGTLGTLMRGALSQATVLIERGAQGGKARLDEALRDRRRREALARLGELALPHLRAGRPDELLDESEVHALLEELDALDDEAAGERGGGTAAAVVDAARGMFSSMRTRWDPRGEGGQGERAGGAIDDADGTVSSGAGLRPPARSGIVFDDDDDDAEDVSGPVAGARAAPPREWPRRAGAGAGPGDEDPDDEDDLAAYMHPDDVPGGRS